MSVYFHNNHVCSNEPGRKRKYVQASENGEKTYSSVEQTALDYYRENGYPEGMHCEGALLGAAFCILFWDIIYDHHVEGVFICDYQSVPLDMHTKYFYLNRKERLQERLSDIKSGWSENRLKMFICETWNLHSREESLFNIELFIKEPEQLYSLIQFVGRDVFSMIMGTVLHQSQSGKYLKGFPDLTLWNAEESKVPTTIFCNIFMQIYLFFFCYFSY